VQWHGDAARLLGLPAGTFSGAFKDYLKHLHGEDVAKIMQRGHLPLTILLAEQNGCGVTMVATVVTGRGCSSSRTAGFSGDVHAAHPIRQKRQGRKTLPS